MTGGRQDPERPDRAGQHAGVPYPTAMPGEERRQRLRRLDDCLNVLEQAHELDLTLVTGQLAELVADRVPTVHPGMLIADAIEEVLRHQEPYMIQLRPEVAGRRIRRRREPLDIRMLLARR